MQEESRWARLRRALRPRGGLSTALVLATVLVVGLAFAWFHRPQVVLSPSCTATVGRYSAEIEPDQARNAAVVSGVAVRRGLPARAATVALATAMQESKLRNISYGDRDSLGLFQQRASQGWGSREQIMNPLTSSGTFYDHLLRIPGWQRMPVTKAAQRVQRSAYPEAYGAHADQSRALAAAFYGQEPAALACRLALPKVVPNAAKRLADSASADLGVTPGQRTSAKLSYEFNDTAAGHARAWGFAHWAVASADEFGVTAVHVAGRVWQRSEAELSWGRDSSQDAATVVIDIAA